MTQDDGGFDLPDGGSTMLTCTVVYESNNNVSDSLVLHIEDDAHNSLLRSNETGKKIVNLYRCTTVPLSLTLDLWALQFASKELAQHADLIELITKHLINAAWLLHFW